MGRDFDRLLAMLAVRAGILSSDQFDQAMELSADSADASVLHRLVERGWISPQARLELLQQAAAKLREHGGNVSEALLSVAQLKAQDSLTDATTDHPQAKSASPNSMTDDRELELTAVYRNEMPNLPPMPSKPLAVKTENRFPVGTPNVSAEKLVRLTDTVHWHVESRSRYSLTRVQGKGGLGQVWLAIDGHLNREVALKEILPAGQSNPETVARLLKEAQITGQLEHPNIVPVYELSRDTEGKPFYTMRFLRGQSLIERIRAYFQRRGSGPHHPLELRELLAIFVSVCNAMGYAHARGVVHRDLKPHNIMLGDYGEVMVVDWGLAKLIHQPDEVVNQRRISVVDVEDLTATHDGQLLGSPAYMAPEQADGNVALLDELTDIYGLGSILFVILCGKAPHKGSPTGNSFKDTMSMIRQISSGPTPRAQSLNPHVPNALDAIAAKAMAKTRTDRYRTALELADDVSRWLADEPVTAYVDPWLDQLMRWLRRHRTAAQVAAVALVLVAIVSSVAAVVVSNARSRTTLALDSEKKAHERTDEALKSEQIAKAEATLRFKEARNAIDKSLTSVSEALQYFPGVETARRTLLEQAAADYERFAEEKSRDPELRLEAGRAQLRLGDVRRLLTQHAAAEVSYRSAQTKFRELAESATANVEYQLELANSHVRLGILLTTTGPHDKADEHFEAAIKGFDALIANGVDSTRFRFEKTGVVINRALLLNKTNQFQAARVSLEETERELQSLDVDGRNPDLIARLAKTRADLGQLLLMLGHGVESVEKLRVAVKTFQTLHQRTPDHPPHLEGLAAARLSLANAFRTLGRESEVITAYEDTIKDYDLLLKARPGIPYYLESLAVVRTDLAQVLMLVGNNPAAKEQAAAALAQFIDLVNTHPEVHRYHEEHATTTQTFGLILRNLNDDMNAEVACEDAIRRFTELAEALPDVPEYRRRLANAKSSLGRLLQKLNRIADAENTFLDAIKDFNAAQESGLDDPLTLDSLAWSHTHLADLLVTSGSPEKARPHYAKALALRESLPNTTEHQLALALLLCNCEDRELRQTDRAIEMLQQAVKLAPGNPRYANALGLAYVRAGQWEKSVAAIRAAQALRLTPHAADGFVLAMAHAKSGDSEKSAAARAAAIAIMTANAPGNIELLKLRDDAQ